MRKGRINKVENKNKYKSNNKKTKRSKFNKNSIQIDGSYILEDVY